MEQYFSIITSLILNQDYAHLSLIFCRFIHLIYYYLKGDQFQHCYHLRPINLLHPFLPLCLHRHRFLNYFLNYHYLHWHLHLRFHSLVNFNFHFLLLGSFLIRRNWINNSNYKDRDFHYYHNSKTKDNFDYIVHNPK